MLVPSLLLALAVTILSQAGNIIRLCQTTPTLVAFLRLTLALALLLPFSIPPLKRGFTKASRPELLGLGAMGIMFAAHFVSWIAAVQTTTVANAAICFSISPLFTAIGARLFLKEELPPRIFLTIFLGLLGIGTVGFSDLSFRPEHLLGDGLALLAGLLFSIYLLIGKRKRHSFENRFVMCLVYGAGALALAPVAAVQRDALLAITPNTWAALLALAVFPTILGHATMIYLMKFFKASTLSVATLIEPVLAGAVAWALFQEPLRPMVLAGYALIVGGLLLGLRKAKI